MSKVAVITGGCRGIGLGISRELLHQGFSLAVTGSSDEEKYAQTLVELRKFGGEVFYLKSNLSDVKASRNVIEKIVSHFGHIDVLVNNAGVAPKVRSDLLEMTAESFDYVVNTNTRGTMFMTQAVARQMIAQNIDGSIRGIIINIASISSEVSSTNRGEYCISKAGISMLTKLYADRLAGEGILVYEIRPGIIRTEMTAGVQEKYDRLLESGISLISRWGLPEDIGKAVTAICSGAFSYSTGQVFFIDGGMHIQRL